MYGFLTEEFLLKEMRMLDVFLEEENSSNGYYSITSPISHVQGVEGRGVLLLSVKRVKCLLYDSQAWNSGGIIRTFFRSPTNLSHTSSVIVLGASVVCILFAYWQI